MFVSLFYLISTKISLNLKSSADLGDHPWVKTAFPGIGDFSDFSGRHMELIESENDNAYKDNIGFTSTFMLHTSFKMMTATS